MKDDLREKFLINRVCRHDDRQAFAELVAANQSRLRLFLQRLCHDPDLSDDLAQETLMVAYQKIDSFLGNGSFQGWLIRIAHRRFLIHARGEKRKHALLNDYRQLVSVKSERYDTLSPDQADLERAIATLNPGEAAAITLCHSFGFSHHEVAGMLDTPLGTVKSQIRRGMEKLRLELSGGGVVAAGDRKKEAL